METGSWVYRGLLLLGLVVGGWLWSRRARNDPDAAIIYLAAIIGSILGAKLAFITAESWSVQEEVQHHWLQMLAGKSVIGALLGGWAGVELAKRLTGSMKPTSDRFAVMTAFFLGLGRLGCVHQGCCQGKLLSWGGGEFRWPAALVEGGFHLAAAYILLKTRERGLFRDRLFFVYLIGYGTFRICHEFLRATPKVTGEFSIYQLQATLMVFMACFAFWHRGRNRVGTV